MSAEILMPSLDASIHEALLVKWLKTEGAQVDVGEAVAEVETDKAVIEVESNVKGIFIKALVEEGGMVTVNAAIALVQEEGEDAGSLAVIPIAAPAVKAEIKTGHSFAEPVVTSSVQHNESPPNREGRILASPLARRMAVQEGLDLSRVSGSGPNGRIVKCDVKNALANIVSETPIVARRPAEADSSELAYLPAYIAINNTVMRNTIARRLTESSRNVPHYFLTIDCNVDKLIALRKDMNTDCDSGCSVSLNDFVICAAAIALKKIPAANAAWTDTAILRFERVDISIAVATDGGLITPVIRNADAKGLTQVSEEARGLAARARTGKLLPEEYRGGTFTISNLGKYGIKSFTSIINPPQGAILSVGVAEQRPVVTDGQLGVATIMTITLAADHRCIDGAVGAEFLAAFKGLIERPIKILI